jgi:hypothetical protein
MYAKFSESFHGRPAENLIAKSTFKDKAPLIVIDCSKQNDMIKQGAVDVRLEIEFQNAVPEATSAYCIIVHDRLIEYKPISGMVQKLV